MLNPIDIHSPVLYGLLDLFELTAPGSTSKVYFSANLSGPTAYIHNGNTYTSFPIAIDGTKHTAKTLPQPALKISDAQQAITATFGSLESLVGGDIRHIRILAKNLDNGSEPNPSARESIDYKIGSYTFQDRLIEFVLTTPADRPLSRYPRRVITADEFPGAGYA